MNLTMSLANYMLEWISYSVFYASSHTSNIWPVNR